MTRLIAAMITGLASLVTVGYGPDDPPPDAQVPQEAQKDAVETKNRVEVRVIQSADQESDATDTLAQTYELLKRLREEKREGRPKEMLDRAVEMYRQAVQRYGSADELEAKSASSLAMAALQLARTVERIGDERRADPDLPPPPRPRAEANEGQALTIRRLDVLPPELDGQPEKDEPRKSIRAKKKIVITRPGGDGKDDVMVFEGDDLDLHGLPEAIGDVLNIDVNVDEDKIRDLSNELYEKARSAAEKALGGSENANRALAWVMGDNPELARAELERAYDKIVKARAEMTEPKDSLYLDAARDLYNKARKEAEAGRNGRAAELARAAVALTLVPEKPDADTQEEEDVIRFPRPERKRDAQKNEMRKEAAREREKAGEGRKEERRVRVEIKPEAEAREESPASGGLGLAFSFEDGVLKVEQVLPDTPAAKDGRIKPGDQILGITGEKGARLFFKDKPREQIVEMLRGEPGTKVGVIVRHGDDEDSEVVELTRDRISFPDNSQEEAAEAVIDALRGAPSEPREVRPVEPVPPAIP